MAPDMRFYADAATRALGPSVPVQDASSGRGRIQASLTIDSNMLQTMLQNLGTRNLEDILMAYRLHIHGKRRKFQLKAVEPNEDQAQIKSAASIGELNGQLFIADPVSHIIWRCDAAKPEGTVTKDQLTSKLPKQDSPNIMTDGRIIC